MGIFGANEGEYVPYEPILQGEKSTGNGQQACYECEKKKEREAKKQYDYDPKRLRE